MGCPLQIQSPQEDPDDLVGGFVEKLNNHDNSYNKYLSFISKAHVSPAYARGGIMAPMITSKTAKALKTFKALKNKNLATLKPPKLWKFRNTRKKFNE